MPTTRSTSCAGARTSTTSAISSGSLGRSWPMRRDSDEPHQPAAVKPRPHVLDPNRLADHTDALYRAAWALTGSAHDAEDLVQETFAKVLRRPRVILNDSELGYLLTTLRNTYFTRLRRTANRPAEREFMDNDSPLQPESPVSARELMEAIASTPEPYRDAVIAIDVLGLSYREAAASLKTLEAT